MDKNMENAYSEVLYILKHIEPEYAEKIPRELFNIFRDECNKEYLDALLSDKTDFKEKDYSKEALSIIAYLNLKYWCETKEEQKYYRDMYLKNNN